ncbi:MAG: HAD family phosphatase [Chlamydiia bacterium]|nr:HAD family phosphatase [Chlamydiia bacterium]
MLKTLFLFLAHTASLVGYDAIIFDCDGVLVDTEYLKFLAWQETLAAHGVPFTIEDYKPLVGHSTSKILQLINENKHVSLPSGIVEQKKQTYRQLQVTGVLPIRPMVEFVHALKGFKLALASSAAHEEIRVNLQQIGLQDAFAVIVSGHDDLENYKDPEGTNKPKPYIYIEAAKQLQVLPENCLVFEDTQAGVEAAAGAGMTVIAIPNQLTLNQDFSKAARVIRSPEEFSQDLLLHN